MEEEIRKEVIYVILKGKYLLDKRWGGFLGRRSCVEDRTCFYVLQNFIVMQMIMQWVQSELDPLPGNGDDL